MSYDNNMKGVLFPNTKKEKGSKQPDYQGSCEIDGTKYELAGWKRQSKEGNPFLSMTIQLPGRKKMKDSEGNSEVAF